MKTDRKTKKRGSLLSNLQSSLPGDSFYTDSLPRVATGYAAIYQIPIKTEIVLILSGLKHKEQICKRVTKVTLL